MTQIHSFNLDEKNSNTHNQNFHFFKYNVLVDFTNYSINNVNRSKFWGVKFIYLRKLKYKLVTINYSPVTLFKGFLTNPEEMEPFLFHFHTSLVTIVGTTSY